jgi:hypothetical protein
LNRKLRNPIFDMKLFKMIIKLMRNIITNDNKLCDINGILGSKVKSWFRKIET